MPLLPTERAVFGVPGTVFFGLLVLLSVVAFVYSMSRRVRVLFATAPENRFERIGTRIRKTIEYAFLQKRMFRDLYAGVFHIFLFTGFVVLLVRTIALVVEGVVPGFVLLSGRAGDAYTFVKDVFEVLVLVGVAMALARRAFARPRRLDLTTDAWFILFLIALLIVTDLLAEGAKVALAGGPASPWAPAVSAVAGMLGGLAAGNPALDLLGLLVDAPRGHPLLRQLPAVLEALPHHHVGAERLLHEARADGAARNARPRSVGAVRGLAGGGPLVEVGARRVHVHGVRALPRRLSDRADWEAPRPEGVHRRRAGRRSARRRRRSSSRSRAAATAMRPPGASSSAAG